MGAIRLDATAFGFAALVTTLVGVIVGAIPAANVLRQDVSSRLQTAGRRTTGGHQRTRALLVVAEVALALMLLVGAGLLLRSIQHIFAVPVGFDASGLLTMQVQLSGEPYRTDSAKARYYSKLLGAVQSVPGVQAAALRRLVPLSGDLDIYGAHLERDRDAQNDGASMRYSVAPEYFNVMGIPLRRGRLLDARDGVGAPRVAVVSVIVRQGRLRRREPARAALPPWSAAGRLVHGRWPSGRRAAVVVRCRPRGGRVRDAPAVALGRPVDVGGRLADEANPTLLATPIRNAIWSVDPEQAIVRVATMNALVNRSIADRRFALTLFEAFGLAALLWRGRDLRRAVGGRDGACA